MLVHSLTIGTATEPICKWRKMVEIYTLNLGKMTAVLRRQKGGMHACEGPLGVSQTLTLIVNTNRDPRPWWGKVWCRHNDDNKKNNSTADDIMPFNRRRMVKNRARGFNRFLRRRLRTGRITRTTTTSRGYVGHVVQIASISPRVAPDTRQQFARRVPHSNTSVKLSAPAITGAQCVARHLPPPRGNLPGNTCLAKTTIWDI